MSAGQHVHAAEVGKFDALAEQWWDPRGKFSPLHAMNPCRLDYINSQIEVEFNRDLDTLLPFSGILVADIGCGGGLLAEPLARLGAVVTGIDAAPRNIPVAQRHAEEAGLTIDYRHATAEQLLEGDEHFDVVLAMEVIEHTADPARFIEVCASLLNPGGLLVVSTLNRTSKSFFAAIVGAEFVLRWLPRGTHDWNRFVAPDELFGHFRSAGVRPVDRKGMVYNPLLRDWSISDRDLGVNYVATGTAPSF